MTEAQYQAKLIKRIKKQFPGCIVMKNDSSYQQGVPDLSIFVGPHWAALEVKDSEDAATQANQPHFVERMNEMSYAAFIYPENEEEVLSEMERAFAA